MEQNKKNLYNLRFRHRNMPAVTHIENLQNCVALIILWVGKLSSVVVNPSQFLGIKSWYKRLVTNPAIESDRHGFESLIWINFWLRKISSSQSNVELDHSSEHGQNCSVEITQ